MRLFVVAAVALFLAPSIVSAETQEPRDTLGVTVLRIEGKGAYVSWTPAPGSTAYEVYRGPTLESLKLLGRTPSNVFWDVNPPDVDLWYVIVSQVEQNSLGDRVPMGPMRGRCLALAGGAGFAFTASNCLPTNSPW